MDIYLYVLDTLADWEIAFLTAEINSGRYCRKDIAKPEIIKVGNTLSAIHTMGGIQIMPDIDVDAMNIKNGDFVILPGADTWQNGNNQKIIDKIKGNSGITIAAICGATMALADNGMLDNIRHTSNGKGFLEMFCKNYRGANLYEDKPATVDTNIITASGTAPLEFTYEVLQKMNVMNPDALNAWYNFYSTKEAQWFYTLMQSVQ